MRGSRRRRRRGGRDHVVRGAGHDHQAGVRHQPGRLVPPRAAARPGPGRRRRRGSARSTRTRSASMALCTECDSVARTRQGRAFQTSRTRIGACSGASRRLSTSQRPNWPRRDRAAGSLVGPASTSARTASGCGRGERGGHLRAERVPEQADRRQPVRGQPGGQVVGVPADVVRAAGVLGEPEAGQVRHVHRMGGGERDGQRGEIRGARPPGRAPAPRAARRCPGSAPRRVWVRSPSTSRHSLVSPPAGRGAAMASRSSAGPNRPTASGGSTRRPVPRWLTARAAGAAAAPAPSPGTSAGSPRPPG